MQIEAKSWTARTSGYLADDLLAAQREVAFVDPDVHGLAAILAGIRPGVDVILLNSTTDALDQIAQALYGRTNLSTIHIISEGAAGRIAFASGSISRDNLTRGSHAVDLDTIGHALGDGGDLLLWGCNIGQGEAGQNLIDAIAEHTGAYVGASTELTGAAALGGNWTLERQTGPIEAGSPLTATAMASFKWVLDETASSVGAIRLTNDTLASVAINSSPSQIGWSVSSAGDINGDGFGDFIIGAPGNVDYYSGSPAAGTAFVVFGSATPFTSPVDLGNLSSSGLGFKIDGISGDDLGFHSGGDEAGWSVSSADVNGDGFSDILVSASHGPNSSYDYYAGQVYVVFGHNTSTSFDDIALKTPPSNVITIDGATAGGNAGAVLSSAGDINSDNHDDFLIGSPYDNGGTVYVVYGAAGATGPGNLDLATFTSGTDGFIITGANQVDPLLGSSSLTKFAAGDGDFNGDGIKDIVVGARGANGGDGAAWIVLGQSGPQSDIDLSSFTTSDSTGLAITATSSASGLGTQVSFLGDVNGDGFDDVIISAPHPTVGQADAYVVFGKATGLSDLDVSALDGTNGFDVTGFAAGSKFIVAVSCAGDANGDGFQDILIGTANQNTGAGATYLLFGQSGIGSGGTIDVSTLVSSQGLKIAGSGSPVAERFGTSVSFAGDVDHDGRADFLIGASAALNTAGTAVPGGAYLIYGSSLPIPVLLTSGGTTDYIDGNRASLPPVVVDGSITVTDISSATLSSATVSIGAGFSANHDVLAFVNDGSTMGNVSGSYDPTTGVLSLSSAGQTATVAEWQAALRAVTFADDAHHATAGDRTISFSVNDGTNDSVAETKTVSLTMARDDTDFTIAESGNITAGSLFADHGDGPDTNPASPFHVSAVNGSAGNVNSQITLASGALLTVHDDGSFDYDPNHAFDGLGDASSGASNTADVDQFRYTIDGGSTAAVKIAISGVDSNDSLSGTSGNDVIDAGIGNDQVRGGGGNDQLSGGIGNDKLLGQSNADTLTGGTGRDLLYGGGAADTFNFTALSDSTEIKTERDAIRDFEHGQDKIQIAISGVSFAFDGSNDHLTHVAGQLVVHQTGLGHYTVWGDVDGDAKADFAIDVISNAALTQSDFIL